MIALLDKLVLAIRSQISCTVLLCRHLTIVTSSLEPVLCSHLRSQHIPLSSVSWQPALCSYTAAAHTGYRCIVPSGRSPDALDYFHCWRISFFPLIFFFCYDLLFVNLVSLNFIFTNFFLHFCNVSMFWHKR